MTTAHRAMSPMLVRAHRTGSGRPSSDRPNLIFEDSKNRHAAWMNFACAAVAVEGRRYSMTWAARSNNDGGTVRSSCLAVFALMTSSNFVGRSTGRSAGFAPFRILST